MEKNPLTEFWTTYQERRFRSRLHMIVGQRKEILLVFSSCSRSIAYLLDRWSMQCEQIPLSVFGAEGDVFEAQTQPASCDIRMFVIQRKS